MRQLSYAGGGIQNQLQQIMERIRQASDEEQTGALEAAGDALATLSIELADTDSIRLYAPRKPRIVNTAIEDNQELDPEARRQMYIQSVVDLAFTFNSGKQRDYVVNALSEGHRIHSQNLPIRDARELLMSAHVIEVGSMASSEFVLKVTPTHQRVKTDYFDATDEFTIELVTRPGHAD
jgi:hypothetical protein